MAFALKARDFHRARSGSGYIRAGFAQVLLKILDLRLLRCARYDSLPFRAARGYHGIFRCTDARIRKPYVRASKLFGSAYYLASGFLNACSESFHCIKVHIYRPRAESASAGQRKMHLAAARQKRAHEKDRRSHALHHALRYDV